MAQSGRLTRQQGFIQKQPQAASQVSNLVNLFEKKATPTLFGKLNVKRVTPSLTLQKKLENEQISGSNASSNMANMSKSTVSLVENVTAGKMEESASGANTPSAFYRSISEPAVVMQTVSFKERETRGVIRVAPVLVVSQEDEECQKEPSVVIPNISKPFPNNTIKRKLDFLQNDTNGLSKVSESRLESKRNKYLCTPKARHVQSNVLPSGYQREENIYDEIGDVPYVIQSAASKPSMSTPNLSSKLELDCNGFGLQTPALTTTPSASVIRHLNNSPDFLRLSAHRPTNSSARCDRPKKTPVKPSLKPNAWIDKEKPVPKIIDPISATKRPKLPVSFSARRVNPTDSPYLGSTQTLEDNQDKENHLGVLFGGNKPTAGHTPRKFLGSLISKIKSTPKKMKISSVSLTDENDKF